MHLHTKSHHAHILIILFICKGLVTTLAGQPTKGYLDGIGTLASFEAVVGVSTSGTNILYVADAFTIRQIVTPVSGNKQTLLPLLIHLLLLLIKQLRTVLFYCIKIESTLLI